MMAVGRRRTLDARSNEIGAMRDRWRTLCRRIGCSAAAARFSELDAAYSGADRVYHTWRHIQECLDVWDRCPEEADDSGALELAIWLHDAVHRPLRFDNEERSAALAASWLGECPSASVEEDVLTGLILSTRHPCEPETRDQALLQDIDLHILGAPPARFAEYEDQVREEYRRVPLPLFERRRARLLKELLQAPFLFRSEWFRERFEGAARRNLERALEGLE